MTGKPGRGAASHEDSISLNKFISDTGFCSRREADKYIEQGRVTINDNVAVPGNRVAAGDIVEIDGEPIGRKKATVYLLYNKPTGVTTTTERSDKTNIIDAIGYSQRIFPVGRLDKDSEGLILLTNDGNIVNKILRAGNAHEKEYIVTVDKPVTPEFIQKMSSGVRILSETTLPCKVVPISKTAFRITLIQGLNRQIRRMCEALGYSVKTLKRVRIMNLQLGNLKTGQWRLLNPEEIRQIQSMVEGSSKTQNTPRQKTKPAAPAKKVETVAKAPKVKNPESKEPAKASKPGKQKTYKDYRKAARKSR